jgi:hypothetical protein
MPNREFVLLTVLVETAKRRWFAAGITLRGEPVPLTCSAAGNLDPYLGAPLDEQVSFLRHRLSGVLQRGCDRLWGRSMKPRHIIFVADADFASDRPELTQRVAEHFVLWMSNPPVAFFTSTNGFALHNAPALQLIAGELDPSDLQLLATGFPQLVALLDQPDRWEPAPQTPPG